MIINETTKKAIKQYMKNSISSKLDFPHDFPIPVLMKESDNGFIKSLTVIFFDENNDTTVKVAMTHGKTFKHVKSFKKHKNTRSMTNYFRKKTRGFQVRCISIDDFIDVYLNEILNKE